MDPNPHASYSRSLSQRPGNSSWGYIRATRSLSNLSWIASQIWQFTCDGQTYERSAIVSWLAMHDTSPMTGEPLVSHELIPNVMARSLAAALNETSHITHDDLNRLGGRQSYDKVPESPVAASGGAMEHAHSQRGARQLGRGGRGGRGRSRS